jgi:hypothetical protein
MIFPAFRSTILHRVAFSPLISFSFHRASLDFKGSPVRLHSNWLGTVFRSRSAQTETQAKQMRKLLDDLGIRCFSTHNDEEYFSAENIHRARDLNVILGSKNVVMASGHPSGADGWKAIADKLNSGPTGILRAENRLPQPSAGVHASERRAALRNPCQEHETLDHSSTRCRHLPAGGLRSRGLDSRQSGPHPLSSKLEGVVIRSRERFPRAVWRRCGRLEEHLYCSGECGRRRILPAGAGREPLLRTRDCPSLSAIFPRHTRVKRYAIITRWRTGCEPEHL